MDTLESIHKDVKVTHLDKTIWENPRINKAQFLSYLVQISPYMLPFLKQKALTTIRYPHGVPGESFFQKNCPDYAPDFIQTKEEDGVNYIVCNNLSTLIWLGNQLAIEYHVPFQTIDSDHPSEVVFDLDPPTRSGLGLAVKAAKEMKSLFDRFAIRSYPKLSGSRGLQIHIPLNSRAFTYEETRIFTSFIAKVLVDRFPDDFTTERLKKNRGNRLYIDYVQHAKGKTLICPYSTRAREAATVAAPLYWEEVNELLRMENFTIQTVIDRLLKGPCPMHDYFEQENRSLANVITVLKKNQ
ncbi:ATP-dependent DNA ligase [Sporolactobacillus sp. THM7-4]|nr:ATP-dependent DNA ligase [Sporolactobacillus sp. THM7-4]